MLQFEFLKCVCVWEMEMTNKTSPQNTAGQRQVFEDPNDFSICWFHFTHCVCVCVIALGKPQVGRAGNKKKARMARTRSDFLNRVPILSVAGESEDDDTPAPPRHFTLPLSNRSGPDADLGECFSDSEMVIASTNGSL